MPNRLILTTTIFDNNNRVCLDTGSVRLYEVSAVNFDAFRFISVTYL